MSVSSRVEHRMRLADANDLPRLIEIAASLPDAARLDLAELQRDDTLFIAEWRTAIDAFLVLLPLQESLLIHRLAVAEEARGRGLGSWLLDFAGQHARRLDLAAIEIQRELRDREAIAWLTGRGFNLLPVAGNRVYLRRPT